MHSSHDTTLTLVRMQIPQYISF